MASAWASLKSEAKTLEQYVERRLHSSAGAAAAGGDVEAGDPALVRLREIDDSLGKLASVVERLGAAAAASASAANAAVAQVRRGARGAARRGAARRRGGDGRARALEGSRAPHAPLPPTPPSSFLSQRFRDVLGDLRGEHRRQAAAHAERANTSALLGAARRDAGGGGGGSGGGGSAATADEILLRERASLQGSARAVDDILAQAAATGEMLAAQRAVIGAAAGRLGGFITRLPGATALAGAIGARRGRNDTIVGLVVAACVCYSAYFLLSRR
jgi:hypothetical protein